MGRPAKHTTAEARAFLTAYSALGRGAKGAFLKEKGLSATTIAAYKRRIDLLDGKTPAKPKQKKVARKVRRVQRRSVVKQEVVIPPESAVTVSVPAASGSLLDVQKQVGAIVAQLGGTVKWAA